MSATYSVEELIRIEFDKFYDNLKFYDLDIHDRVGELLTKLEDNVVDYALSKYTTEVEEIKEEAYDEGWENGREVGYDEGCNDGYDSGYQDAKEELST